MTVTKRGHSTVVSSTSIQRTKTVNCWQMIESIQANGCTGSWVSSLADGWPDQRENIVTSLSSHQLICLPNTTQQPAHFGPPAVLLVPQWGWPSYWFSPPRSCSAVRAPTTQNLGFILKIPLKNVWLTCCCSFYFFYKMCMPRAWPLHSKVTWISSVVGHVFVMEGFWEDLFLFFCFFWGESFSIIYNWLEAALRWRSG